MSYFTIFSGGWLRRIGPLCLDSVSWLTQDVPYSIICIILSNLICSGTWHGGSRYRLCGEWIRLSHHSRHRRHYLRYKFQLSHFLAVMSVISSVFHALSLLDSSILNTGENLLALVRGLSLNDDPPSPESLNAAFVFFGVLGLWYVSYAGWVVLAVHGSIALCGCFMILRLTKSALPAKQTTIGFWMSLLKGEFYCICVTLMSGLVTALAAWLLCPMRFYDSGLVAVYAIYLPPVFASAFYVRGQIRRSAHTSFDIRILSSLLFWTALLLLCMACSIGSGFLGAMWVMAIIVAYFARYYTLNMRTSPFQLNKVLGLYAYEFCFALAICMWWNLLHTLLQIVLPLLGRVGTVVPGDFVVGAIVSLIVILPVGTLLADTVCHPPSMLDIRNFLFAMVPLLLIFAIATDSYSATRPKRMWIHHVQRDRTGADGSPHVDHGIFMTAMDGRGMYPFLPGLGSSRVDVPPQLNENNRRVNYCSNSNGDCYFEFPWLYPVADAMRDSFYIPTQKPPAFPEKSKVVMTLSSQAEALPGQYRYITILLTGPAKMNLIVRDNARGNRIVGWDINIDRPKSTPPHYLPPSPARPEGIYYIQVEFGLCPNDVCEGEVRLKVKGNSFIEVAAYGYYMSLQDAATDSLLTSLPDWAKKAEWSSCPSIIVSKFI